MYWFSLIAKLRDVWLTGHRVGTPEHFQKYKYKKLVLGIEIDTFTRKE